MSFTRQGNLGTVAENGIELFGGPCYVAASRFGSGLWTEIGLVPRIEVSPGLFSQGQGNEIEQELGDTTFQASGGGTDSMISMNLKRWNSEQLATLFPSVIKIVEAGANDFGGSATSKGGIGWDVNPGFVESVGLHIRPALAYGAAPGNLNCFWIPQVRAKSFGTYVYKTEAGDQTDEEYTVEFAIQRLARKDFTPGTPQDVAPMGRMFYRGDPDSIVSDTWENYLPYGFIGGAPGRPEEIKLVARDEGFTVDVTAPKAEFLVGISGTVSYKFQYRVDDGLNGDFTEGSGNITPGTPVVVGSLTNGTRYEVRAWAEAASGTPLERRGQQAVRFVTPKP